MNIDWSIYLYVQSIYVIKLYQLLMILGCSLRKLDLSDNQLHTLPKEMEELKQLEELDISHNQITNYPGNIYKLSELW